VSYSVNSISTDIKFNTLPHPTSAVKQDIKISSNQYTLPDREWIYSYAGHRDRLSYTKRFNIIGVMQTVVEDYQ
jgi:hypothetical protein